MDFTILKNKIEALEKENRRLQSRTDSAHIKIKFLEGLWDSVVITLQNQEKENRRLSMNLSTLQGNVDAITTILKDLVKKDWEK